MMTGVVNCAVYTDGRRMADVDISDIQDALRHQEGFIWIELHEPEEELLREVQRQFELHDLAVEDAHLATSGRSSSATARVSSSCCGPPR